MANFYKSLFCLILFLFSPVILAGQNDYDGKWNVDISCSINSNNQMPAFDYKEVWTIQNNLISQTSNKKTKQGDEQTIWKGRISDKVLTINAEGNNDNTKKPWLWKGSGLIAGNDAFQINADMIGRVGTKVRDCTLKFTSLEPAVGSLANNKNNGQTASSNSSQSKNAVSAEIPKTPVNKLLEETLQKANAGDPTAMNLLGNLYYTGSNGVDKNLTEAKKWFEASAKKDFPPGNFNMGALYEKGDAAPKDINKAIQYYKIAASGGSQAAQKKLDGLGVAQPQIAPKVESMKPVVVTDKPKPEQAPLLASASTKFNDIGGFDIDFPQSPNDPKRIIKIEIAQYRNKDIAYRVADTISDDYVAIQVNKNGTAWRLLTKGSFSTVSKTEEHILMMREKKFPSPRVVFYNLATDNQIVTSINKDVEAYNKQLHASKTPPPVQKIVLMDAKSNGSVAGSCQGVMFALSASNGYVKTIPMDIVMSARKLQPIFAGMYKGGPEAFDRVQAYNYSATQSLADHAQEYLDTFNFCKKALSK